MKRNLFKDGYTAEDFLERFKRHHLYGGGADVFLAEESAEIANAILSQAKKDAIEVFGSPHKTTAFGNIGFYILKKGKSPNKRFHTHRGLLINMEEN